MAESCGRTDAELVRAIRTGSRFALETLYLRYLPPLWRYVWAQGLGERQDAEDVISEAFLVAINKLVAGEVDADGRPLYPWLVGVARHKLGDLRRRRRKSPVTSDELAQVVSGSGMDDPVFSAQKTEEQAQVATAMVALDDEQRLALEWKYVDGLSVRDIAQHTGRSEKAVEALLYRARNAFRSVFCRMQKGTSP